MRLRIYIAVFCVHLCSCADTVDFFNKNSQLLCHAHLMSDRVNERLVAPGFSYSSNSALLSPIYHENWHGFDKALAIGGSDLLGIYSLGASNAAVRGLGLVAPAVTGNGQYAPVVSNLEGMAIPAWQGQPIAQGSDNAILGQAVQAAIPANTTPATKAAILQAAATLVQSQAPPGARTTPQRIDVRHMQLQAVNGEAIDSLVP